MATKNPNSFYRNTYQYFIHPLALESQLFITSLECYGEKYNHIDPTLCDLLRDVLSGIQKFMNQHPVQIVASEKTKLLPPNELKLIQPIYHCSLCKQDVGKSAEKAVLHLAEDHRCMNKQPSKKEKKDKKQSGNIVKLPKKAKALMMRDSEKTFAEQLQVAEKLKQIPEYAIIEDTLQMLLEKTFPDKSIKLYKFGSRMTGTSTRNSDLDIYADIGGQFNVFEQSASEETLNRFDRIYEMVKKNAIDWQQVHPVRSARVPIIRMTNSKTGIECDLGFSNSLSYCNTQLLQYIYQQQPIARRLVMFMKKWLERTKLNERITTYCMSLMVIYYLQVKNLLPSIQTLQKNMLANVLVGPWIGNFIEIPLTDLKMRVVSVSPPHCKKHIKEFCMFYAKFNYESHVVCPYFGCKNIEFKSIASIMPKRYKDFVSNENSPKSCGLQIDTPMVVQDPFQMNHNVAARATKTDLKEWVAFLWQSADILELK